jgi:hypothetical protein
MCATSCLEIQLTAMKMEFLMNATCLMKRTATKTAFQMHVIFLQIRVIATTIPFPMNVKLNRMTAMKMASRTNAILSITIATIIPSQMSATCFLEMIATTIPFPMNATSILEIAQIAMKMACLMNAILSKMIATTILFLMIATLILETALISTRIAILTNVT